MRNAQKNDLTLRKTTLPHKRQTLSPRLSVRVSNFSVSRFVFGGFLGRQFSQPTGGFRQAEWIIFIEQKTSTAYLGIGQVLLVNPEPIVINGVFIGVNFTPVAHLQRPFTRATRVGHCRVITSRPFIRVIISCITIVGAHLAVAASHRVRWATDEKKRSTPFLVANHVSYLDASCLQKQDVGCFRKKWGCPR